MYVSAIRLSNWRNYEEEYFELSPARNVICGENAQGKTNLLEAIYYLASGTSFRTHRDAELIRDGADHAEVAGEVSLSDRAATLRVALTRGSRRRLFANEVPSPKVGDFVGRLRAVLFVPGDLALVSGSPSERRRFLDGALTQLRPRYAEALSQYRRIHEHRTHILRDYREQPSLLGALDAYSERAARVGAVLISYRARLIRGLSAHAAVLHSEISGGRETLELRYKTDSAVTDPFASEADITSQLLDHYEQRWDAELARGMALVGPHRDELELNINGKPAQSHASQGQTRTAALALKLAERELFAEDSGELPVLLLDDVLSELDPNRREWVLERVGGGQVIITLCDAASLEISAAKVFTIGGGRILTV